MPTTVAVESEQQPLKTKNAEVKVYTVPISGDIQATLTGHVQVYAASEAEAIAKVQAQIDAETLDDDLEMEDFDSGYTMSYNDMTQCLGTFVEIDEGGVEVDDLEEVDPADVLRDDITQLEALISWDTEKLTRQKEFLESLTGTQATAKRIESGTEDATEFSR